MGARTGAIPGNRRAELTESHGVAPSSAKAGCTFMPVAPSTARLVQRLAGWAMLALLWHHANQYAWMAEDAFINFRVIDHALHGLGPNWNPGERVQAYTSVAWMALSIPVTALTHDPIGATWLLSMALCAWLLGMFWLASGRLTWWWMLAVLIWVSSRSVRDYLCSGLESPLVMAATATLVVLSARERTRSSERQAICMAMALALCALVRHDLLPLLAPLAVDRMWRDLSTSTSPARQTAWRLLRCSLLGAWPLLAWSLWAWLYYGSPLPNTASAKIVTGWDAHRQALHYFAYMQTFDPWGCGAMAMSAVAIWWSGSRLLWPVLAGLGLYAAYLLAIGGDYMAGRFMVGPITLCMCAWALSWRDVPGTRPPVGWLQQQSPRTATAASLATLCVLGAATLNVRSDVDTAVHLPLFVHGITDERLFHVQQTDLHTLQTSGVSSRWRQQGRLMGELLKEEPTRGPFILCNIGMAGYFAPSQAVIIDPLALADRFLAGLPPAAHTELRVGHMERPIPREYMLSRLSGTNQFSDPLLAAYYDDVQLVTTGPLLAPARLQAIARLNLGTYRARLQRWQPDDAGGRLLVAAGATPNRARYCLGSGGELMGTAQAQGQLTVVTLPQLSHQPPQAAAPADAPKTPATPPPGRSSGG